MKQWVTTLAILALLPATLALAEDFNTISGKLYKDATIIRVEADGIVLRTKSAIVKLYFSELPKEVQKGFQYDPAKTTVASSPYQKAPMNVARPSALPAAIEKLQSGSRIGTTTPMRQALSRARPVQARTGQCRSLT